MHLNKEANQANFPPPPLCPSDFHETPPEKRREDQLTQTGSEGQKVRRVIPEATCRGKKTRLLVTGDDCGNRSGHQSLGFGGQPSSSRCKFLRRYGVCSGKGKPSASRQPSVALPASSSSSFKKNTFFVVGFFPPPRIFQVPAVFFRPLQKLQRRRLPERRSFSHGAVELCYGKKKSTGNRVSRNFSRGGSAL